MVGGRIISRTDEWNQDDGPPVGGWSQTTENFNFDGRNRRSYTYNRTPTALFDENYTEETLCSWNTTESRSFYDADDRLAYHQVNREDDFVTPRPSGCPTIEFDTLHYGVFEEYWYDALGRRVMTLSRQQGDHCEISERCNTHVDRAIWDGNQLLYDIRWDGISDSWNPGTGDDRGRIVYVHGGGIDQPLGLVRNGTAAVLHHDYRGLPVAATDEDGAMPTCGPGESSGCLDVRWPGGTWIATLGAKVALATPDWYGALSVAQRDDTGNLYRRNRYYDPASGQFTQADPISIAGGMNVYGFGNGDPVNFSDPFGLCPMCIGAAIGFFSELGVQALDRDWSVGAIAGSTMVGAASGGLTVGRAAGGLVTAGRAVAQGGLSVLDGMIRTGAHHDGPGAPRYGRDDATADFVAGVVGEGAGNLATGLIRGADANLVVSVGSRIRATVDRVDDLVQASVAAVAAGFFSRFMN